MVHALKEHFHQLLFKLNTGWGRCLEISSGDHVCCLISAPNPFSTLCPFCMGRRENLEYFFPSPSWLQSGSGVFLWQQLQLSNLPCNLQFQLSPNLNHLYYSSFFFRNGGTFGWSRGSLTSTLDSPKPTTALHTGPSLNSLWKSQLIILFVFNQNSSIDKPQNAVRSFLLCMRLRTNILGKCQLSTQTISISSNHMKVPWKAQEVGKEEKDKDNMWPERASVFLFHNTSAGEQVQTGQCHLNLSKDLKIIGNVSPNHFEIFP